MNQGTTDQGMTMAEWAQRLVPNLDVVSASVPEPVLQRHNLVAVCSNAARAREVVRDWERIEAADGAVGFVVMGVAPDRPTELARPTGVDPERVTGTAARAALRGAVPGAVAGAVVVAVVVLLLDGWGAAVIGAALGGAAFGSVAGAVMAFTHGVGWGSAYRHSFVDERATAAAFASIHSDDPRPIGDAFRSVDDGDAVSLYRVHRDGRVERASARP
jgi:hypothetical protein